jgi:hypothetical protein
MEGLMGLRRPEQVAKLRGLTVNQVLGIQKNGPKQGQPDKAEQAGAGPTAPEPTEAEGESSKPPATEGVDG